MHSEEAARNPTWLKLSTSFVHTAIEYGSALKSWPPVLRPVVAYFLPQRLEKEQQLSGGREIIAKSLARKKALGGAPLENPPTMLDHLTSGAHASKADDLELQLILQMTLAVASIHTTSSTITQVLYDLAVQPDQAEELRLEVVEVLEKSGGVFTKQSLAEMKKLDSWMKESLRMSAPDMSKFSGFDFAYMQLLCSNVLTEFSHISKNGNEALDSEGRHLHSCRDKNGAPDQRHQLRPCDLS